MLQPQMCFLQCDWQLKNSPESAKHPYTLSSPVGLGTETTVGVFLRIHSSHISNLKLH